MSLNEVNDDDIFDLSFVTFDNDETWLMQPKLLSSLINVDIRVWLRENPTNNVKNEKCKFIDSRTWTRPKKRFSKLSFNSILSESRLSDEIQENNNNKSFLSNKIDINIKEENSKLPLMLKLSSMQCDTSNQESLEAFANFSQANGVDSFINMQVPELNEISTSNNSNIDSKITIKSEENINYDEQDNQSNKISMIDSQILTDSMMQTSIFNDSSHSIHFTDISLSKNQPSFANLDLNETLTDENKSDDEIHHSIFSIKNNNNNNNNNNNDNNNPSNYLSYIVDKPSSNDEFCQINKTNDFTQKQIELENGNENLNCDNFEEGNSTYTNLEIDHPVEILNSTFTSNNNINSDSLSSSFIIKPLNSTFCKTDETYNNEIYNQTYLHISTPISTKQLSQLDKIKTVPVTSTPLLLNKNDTCDHTDIGKNKTKNKPINYFNTYRKNNANILFKNKDFENIEIDKKDINFTNENNIKSKLKQNKSKLITPNTLSRLPQIFQKSNPNLTYNSCKNSKLSLQFGFKKENEISSSSSTSSSSSSLLLLKMKNKSEKKAIDTTIIVSNYNSNKNEGSTESLESTQSAPDIDARSSSSSSSSLKSKTKICKIDNNKILKNNWVDNLPSPISKDGHQSDIGDNIVVMKTSSPIISSADSAESLQYNDRSDSLPESKKMISEENGRGIGIVPPSGIRTAMTTNNSSNNHNHNNNNNNNSSGIPRPTSRIPAPKFSTSKFKSQIGK